MYHEPEKPPPWWLEALVLTRAVFAILFWPLAALFGGIVVIVGLIFALAARWAWGLLLIAAAVAAFAWWERRRALRARF